MNTDRLVAAYDDLLTAAALLDPTILAASQQDEAEWLIAHLILSDPILIAAADHVLARADTVVVDNRHAIDNDTSVFHHMASAPGAPPNWEANGIMIGIGVAAALLGGLAFMRRDLQGP